MYNNKRQYGSKMRMNNNGNNSRNNKRGNNKKQGGTMMGSGNGGRGGDAPMVINAPTTSVSRSDSITSGSHAMTNTDPFLQRLSTYSI